MVEKYRRIANAAFGFGIELDDPSKLFEIAVWVEGEWTQQPEMERVSEKIPPLKLSPGQKMPLPDEACICGSRKPFKNVLGDKKAH